MFKDPGLSRAINENALARRIVAGGVLLHAGDTITHMPIVRTGSLRILARNAEGQERYLYHIMPGETCAMTLTCCTGRTTSNVVALAEEDTEVLLVPIRFLEEWMSYPEWRRFVAGAQAQRFTELLEAVELVAFTQLDEQLWDYLQKRAQAAGDRTIRITHQEVAQELDSPREVITRLLHQLQRQGRVELARGSIAVKLPALSEKG